MKTYLPRKLNLDKHLKQHPPKIEGFNKDNLIYILGLITELPARCEHFDYKYGFVSLNATILKKKVWNYKQYLDYAVSTGILKSDNWYIKGTKSKGYKFTDKYLDKNKEVPILKYSLIKKEYQEKEIEAKILEKYYYLTKWFNEDLTIDYSGALDFLESTMTGSENVYKYNYNLSRIDKISSTEYYTSVDGNIQRFHSTLTSLHGDLRKFIKYADEELVSLDITNSQPYLSTALFNPLFYNNQPNNLLLLSLYSINHHSVLSPISLSSSPMLQEILQQSNNDDIKKYVDLVTSGSLYEFLARVFKREIGDEFKNRKQLKGVIFTVLFTSNHFIGQPEAKPKRIFRKYFPTVYKIFSLIKRGDKTNLPRLLQRMESYIVLDRICKRISLERPNLPIFTIHDSVITTKGNEDYVKGIMLEELRNCIGYEPKLKIESWNVN